MQLVFIIFNPQIDYVLCKKIESKTDYIPHLNNWPASLPVRIEALIVARPHRAESNDSTEIDRSSESASSPNQVPADLAAVLIGEGAKRAGVKVGLTLKAPVSVFGTSSYRATVSDGKGVIYCHADGPHRGTAFYVRKGIGWFYERVLLGVSSRLGLPITNEEVAHETGFHTSRFEGGYIEWSP